MKNTGSPRLHVVRPGQQLEDAASPRPSVTRTSWTADELMATEFPPPCWAVPGLLAEGVNLLAGPPKVGKSWLSLGLGMAVAGGGRAFEAIAVDPGPVLYLALEDTGRRLQSRMRRILGDQPAPAALTLATSCPPLPAGGDVAISAWLNRHPDARLVVIDVFAKVRGQSAAGASAYEGDYAAVGRVKRIADDYGVAVLLVHHVRKAGSDDFLNEVSGTNGLAGAADATLVLKRARGQADGVLHITGRDVEEAEYALSFHAGAGAWHLLDGPAEDHVLPDTRATILRYLREHPSTGPKAIAEATGIALENVKKTCQRMAADAQLHADAAGRYRVPAVPTVPVPAPTSTDAPDLWGHTAVPAVPSEEEPH